jgi:hypothetical protein
MSVRNLLGDLLQPPMEVTNIRTAQMDYFTIRAEDETEDPMGTGMVRAHVEDHCFCRQRHLLLL